MSLVRTGKIRTNFLGRLGVWRSSTCLNIKSMRTSKKLKKVSSVETVRETRNHLIWLSNDTNQGTKLGIKIETELSKLIREIKSILYGTNESEAVAEECENLTREFFKDNTLRLLIMCLPRLGLESRKDATQVVANLQRQQVGSHLIASIYLETNLDLVDYLISKYEDPDLGLHCGSMLRECIRHQNVTRHVLAPNHVRKFFDYIQLPSFDIAADATETFKVLLTRHKSTVSRFLSRNYEWFFQDYDSKLLESDSYFTKRTAVQLLREILLHPSNSAVMIRYVSSKDHLIILMNLLRDSSKTIRINAFHIFKLFIGNESKPEKITSILAANQIKLIRFFAGFKNDLDEDDEQFEDDKAEVVRQIAQLQL